jgi:hypothetical protein
LDGKGWLLALRQAAHNAAADLTGRVHSHVLDVGQYGSR